MKPDWELHQERMHKVARRLAEETPIDFTPSDVGSLASQLSNLPISIQVVMADTLEAHWREEEIAGMKLL